MTRPTQTQLIVAAILAVLLAITWLPVGGASFFARPTDRAAGHLCRLGGADVLPAAMRRFVLKRLLAMIPLLIGISFLCFAVLQLAPGISFSR